MKRKINAVGTGTLTVSLPNKWAQKYNLKKGDELNVAEEGGSLVLNTSEKKTEKKTKIKVHGSYKLVRRYILSTFRRGYDEVYVEFDDPQVLEYIQDALNLMIGYEIVSQGLNYCIIKNLTDIIETEFEPLMRRFFLISLSMSEQVTKAFKEEDLSQLKNVIMLEKTQNKVYITMSKIIISKGNYMFKYPSFLLLLIELIEETGDNFRDLSKHYLNKNISLSKPTLRYLEKSHKYMRDIYDLYYKYTPENADLLDKKRYEFQEQGHSLLEKAPPKERVLLYYLLCNSQLVYKAGSPVFSLKVE